jgi:hypothetical protein
MDGDFGAELDAALNARLDELRAAADTARARIDRGVDAPADSEGIPLPEDNL